jgi:hypothetical protein
MKAAEFLEERRDFVHAYATPSVSGEGWDVVLRIDGTYATEEDALEAAEGIRQQVLRISDVPNDGWTWLNGPPFSLRSRPPRLSVLAEPESSPLRR